MGRKKYLNLKKKRERKTLIPQSVSNVRDETDTEIQKYYISFKSYNDDECEINCIDNPATVLSSLKTIGQISSYKELIEKGIGRGKVKNTGVYKRFYCNLSKDITLKKHKVGYSRVFYYLVKKLFNIVAITRHPETGKTRR